MKLSEARRIVSEARKLPSRQLETLKTVAALDGQIVPAAGNTKFLGMPFHSGSADALRRKGLIALRGTGEFWVPGSPLRDKTFPTAQAALNAVNAVDSGWGLSNVEERSVWVVTDAGRAALP